MDIQDVITQQLREEILKHYSESLSLSLDNIKVLYQPTEHIYISHFPIVVSKCLQKKGIESTPEKIIETIVSKLECFFLDLIKIDCTPTNIVRFKCEKQLIELGVTGYLMTKTVITPTTSPLKILVDYSSPNIAKDMHVGHLRSTIIGDGLANLFELHGHKVYRINHVGDFGTQFGMLLQQLDKDDNYKELKLDELQKLYKEAKNNFKHDPEFKKLALDKVKLFQNKDEESIKTWRRICDVSREGYEEIYTRLKINNLIEVGESFYQSRIPDMIADLETKKLITLEEDGGRKLLFVKGIKEPLIVEKSDGSYGYDATDLTAIKYRLQELKMDRIIYVVDAGQSLHFRQLFEAAKMAQWIAPHQTIQHVEFGLVLGEDGKRLRSSDGDTRKLVDFLDDGLTVTRDSLIKNSSDKLTPEEIEMIVPKVAYSAIKYADLSNNRKSDYKFSHEAMLELKGNTVMYLMYGYVRISAIFRKANKFDADNIILSITDDTHEFNLYEYLLQWTTVINHAQRDLELHKICGYLYELIVFFNRFFTNCRCLEFDEKGILISQNNSRLRVIKIVKKILKTGFKILGIEPIEKI